MRKLLDYKDINYFSFCQSLSMLFSILPIVLLFSCLVVLLSGCCLVICLLFSCLETKVWEFGWKPIPSKARVTRDEVSGIKKVGKSCLEDSTTKTCYFSCLSTSKIDKRWKKNESSEWIVSPFCWFLTVVNTFSALFQEKYFLSFVIPPFHLSVATILIVNALCVVELVVELGWNYMKFHP